MKRPLWVQLDVRIAKGFRLGGTSRVKANLDLYNVLNANDVRGVNSAYGARWLNVTQIMIGRFARFGVQLDF